MQSNNCIFRARPSFRGGTSLFSSHGSCAEVALAVCDAVSLTHAPGCWERRLFFFFSLPVHQPEAPASLPPPFCSYGNCILPEVMGTVKDTPEKPMRKAMFKAYNWEFALVAPYYLLVGIAGYW